MSDSDNDNSAAIDKAVDAFRAQREQGNPSARDDDAEASAESSEPTTVQRLDEPAPKGGGSSDSPTRAFKIPTEAIAAATEAAATEAAATAGPDPIESDSTDTDRTADLPAGGAGLVEEHIVGEPMTAEPVAAAGPIEAGIGIDKASLVENSVDLPSDDALPTEKISTEKIAAATAAGAAAAAGARPATGAPTQQMAPPPAPAPAAAPVPAAAEKPAPQVVAPSAPEASAKKGRGKLVGILLAVAVVVIVVAIGLWYALVGSSTEHKVADAAESYQKAMASGDLSSLRDLTCGAENEYYSTVSADEFAKAAQAQKNSNQMMTFDGVKAVEITGDTARVGVDMYPSGDPSKTAAAQITLHNVDGGWKVCKQP